VESQEVLGVVDKGLTIMKTKWNGKEASNTRAILWRPFGDLFTMMVWGEGDGVSVTIPL